MKVCRIVLPVLLICIAGCTGARIGEIARFQIDLYIYEELNPGFPTGGWTFFTGAHNEIGAPSEAFLAVYARKGNVVVPVRRRMDLGLLEGINIQTEEHAVHLVLFFTREDIFCLFKPGDHEGR